MNATTTRLNLRSNDISVSVAGTVFAHHGYSVASHRGARHDKLTFPAAGAYLPWRACKHARYGKCPFTTVVS
jgi:hypothetical protein